MKKHDKYPLMGTVTPGWVIALIFGVMLVTIIFLLLSELWRMII